MVKILTIKIKVVPKPRGNIGKFGNLYHSSQSYNDFNKIFINPIKKVDFKLSEKFQYISFKFFLKPRRGHPLDGDNIQGAVQDALVKSKVIPDDNLNIINKWHGEIYTSDKDFDYIQIYFIKDKSDFLYTIKKYF